MKRLAILSVTAALIWGGLFASQPGDAAGVSATNPCVGAVSPGIKHLVIVWFENTSASSDGTVSGAPFVNSLVKGCGHVQRMTDANYKVDMTTKDGSYNSKPSYATAASGVSPTVHGLKDDTYTTKSGAANVWRQAEQNNLDARSYVEGRASGDVCSGGGSSSGSYHDSLRYWTNVSNAWCNSHDLDLSKFDSANLPTVAQVHPKNTSNWHDNSISAGDTWLKNFLTPLLDSPAYAAGDVAVLFATDEETPIVNAMVAPSVMPGSVMAKASHFSTTRLIDTVLGVPLIGDAAQAPDLLPLFNAGSNPTTTTTLPTTTTTGPPTTTTTTPPTTTTTVPPVQGCETVTRTYSGSQGKTRPGTISGRVDARAAWWLGQEPYPITFAAAPGSCWQGGTVFGTWPTTASWDTFHHTGAINAKGGAANLTISDMAVVNYGDSFRFEAGATNWTLDHVRSWWGHDDAIEDDALLGGTIRNSLFESYVGFSARDDTNTYDGTANTVTIDNSTLRLQPTPTVYKGTAPGTGGWFKLGAKSPSMVLRGSTFVAQQLPNHQDLKPPTTLKACSGNTVLWLGDGDFPERAAWSSACPDTTIVIGFAAWQQWLAILIGWQGQP